MCKESNDKQMLQLNQYAREYINNYDNKVDYQMLTKQMREFSDAEYVMFNIFDENGKDFTLVGFEGNKKNINKAIDLIGYNIIGKKFKYEEGRNEKFEKAIVTKVESLKELVGNALPTTVTSVIEKIFNIDSILTVRITKDDKTIGNFTLIFSNNQNKNDDEMLKLFASQVGLFIDKKNSEQKTLEAEKRFQSLLKNSVSIIAIVDNVGNYVEASDSAAELIGIKREELIGKNFKEVLPEKNEDFMNTISIINKTKKPKYKEEIYYINNEERIYESIVFPIEQKNNEVVLFGSIANDITDKREKQHQIEYLSLHDHLTGLYNRRYMEDSIKRMDTERNIPFSIIVADINGLKLTNDSYGHEMGDKLLIAAAEILKKSCRREDIICRVGGDEFVILLPNVGEKVIKKILERIKEESQNTKLDSVIVSLAIGYSTKNSKDKDISGVYKEADNNMYKNKLKYGKIMRNKTIETVLLNINNKYDNEQIHSERVSQYCTSIARAMNLSDKEIEDAKIAGALHDIGKIVVPPEILNKQNRLTEDDWETIKKHAITSYQLLKSVDEYANLSEAVLYHHEKIDGSGYPEGLRDNEIPLLSKLIAGADAYEAMTSRRPYQKEKTKKEAIEELKKHSGTQFDKVVVEIFTSKVL